MNLASKFAAFNIHDLVYKTVSETLLKASVMIPTLSSLRAGLGLGHCWFISTVAESWLVIDYSSRGSHCGKIP